MALGEQLQGGMINHLIDRLSGGAEQARSLFMAEMSRVVILLDEISNNIDDLNPKDEYVRRPFAGNADATGVFEIELGGPKPGFIWLIDRITTVVTGGLASIGVVYVGPSSEPGNATHQIPDADFFADDIGVIFVPSGTSAWIRISGAPANAPIRVSFQAKEERV